MTAGLAISARCGYDTVMSNMTTVERAFELAREGRCRSVDDIRRQLKAERFDSVEGHLAGGTIKRQLVQALNARS